MRLAQEQPDNVCFDCGIKWGSEKPRNHDYRVWLDTCDVCNKLTAVSDAAEYKYLKVGWDGAEVLC
jgi:hypothetical protein